MARRQGRTPDEVTERAQGQGQLTREVEKAVLQHLAYENEEIRRDLAAMKPPTTSAAGSEPVRTGPPPPPPPPATPDRQRHAKRERYRPHKTRVPDSPEESVPMLRMLGTLNQRARWGE